MVMEESGPTYYVIDSMGHRFGPVDATRLGSWLDSGRVSPESRLESLSGGPELTIAQLLKEGKIATAPPVSGPAAPKPSVVVEQRLPTFSIGAGILYPFWGFYHERWWLAIIFIATFTVSVMFFPPLALVVSAVIGLQAYQWADTCKRYESREQMLATMRVWDKWGIAALVVLALLFVLVLVAYYLMIAELVEFSKQVGTALN